MVGSSSIRSSRVSVENCHIRAVRNVTVGVEEVFEGYIIQEGLEIKGFLGTDDIVIGRVLNQGESLPCDSSGKHSNCITVFTV